MPVHTRRRSAWVDFSQKIVRLCLRKTFPLFSGYSLSRISSEILLFNLVLHLVKLSDFRINRIKIRTWLKVSDLLKKVTPIKNQRQAGFFHLIRREYIRMSWHKRFIFKCIHDYWISWCFSMFSTSWRLNLLSFVILVFLQ